MADGRARLSLSIADEKFEGFINSVASGRSIAFSRTKGSRGNQHALEDCARTRGEKEKFTPTIY